MTRNIVHSVLLTVGIGGGAAAQDHPSMPAGMSHEEHLKQMQHDQELKARGGQAMGFDQDAAVHHFTLTRSGGFIAVDARDAKDTETVGAIRAHLQMIAKQFADGDFSGPFATHAETPPGVAVLQRLRGSIAYTYQDTSAGGRVEVRSDAGDAVGAVHAFLRYQITEHRTGDSTAVTPQERDYEQHSGPQQVLAAGLVARTKALANLPSTSDARRSTSTPASVRNARASFTS